MRCGVANVWRVLYSTKGVNRTVAMGCWLGVIGFGRGASNGLGGGIDGGAWSAHCIK